jgi:hypothetical protein
MFWKYGCIYAKITDVGGTTVCSKLCCYLEVGLGKDWHYITPQAYLPLNWYVYYCHLLVVFITTRIVESVNMIE